MLWLYIGAYVTVAGAEPNAELERQTARDTTTGRPEPWVDVTRTRPAPSGSRRVAETSLRPGG